MYMVDLAQQLIDLNRLLGSAMARMDQGAVRQLLQRAGELERIMNAKEPAAPQHPQHPPMSTEARAGQRHY